MGALGTLVDTLALIGEWAAIELKSRNLRSATRRPTRRHLGLFAWALPPNSNAGVHRPMSLLRYGPGRGWRIDAFQGEVPENQREHGEELLAQVPPEVRMHVVQSPRRNPSFRMCPRIDGGFKDALAYGEAAFKQLQEDPPSVVMASGPPFFVFVAAMYVAKRFCAPLVLDYRDEWSECPFDFVERGGHDRWWESRCLAAASAVLFTTDSHRRHQISAFPELDEARTYVVPNGWEAADFERVVDSGRIPLSSKSTIALAHIGNLAGHTPPHEFLASLENLLRIRPGWQACLRVSLIGRRSPQAEEAIRAFAFPAVLDVVDHVGKREANRRMCESDALLLLATRDLERYLPGKLFDYLAARRPVLMFGFAGEASRLLTELGVGVLCEPGDSAALGDALDRLAHVEAAAPSRELKLQGWLEEHRREVLAERTFGIIDRIADTE